MNCIRNSVIYIFLALPLFFFHGGIFAADDTKMSTPSVGVFYFPGWHDGAPGLARSIPWSPIKTYKEREPMLGWYDDGEQKTVDQQLNWMAEYGIDYVVFDWYWGARGVFLNHSVDAYIKSDVKSKIPFAIMWSNHDAEPTNIESFRTMVQYWISNYLKRPEYLKHNGYPVVMIFSANQFQDKVRKIGVSPGDLIAVARKLAQDSGLPGIEFLVGANAGDPIVESAATWKIDGYFAYNYHSGPFGKIGMEARPSHSYTELDQAYRDQWKWFSANTDLSYLPPVTAGWDKRPWGGSVDSYHDLSISTSSSFGEHLKAAANFLTLRKPDSFKSMIVCCWNEFGEGSVVEPTKAQGFDYLKEILKISPGRQSLSSYGVQR